MATTNLSAYVAEELPKREALSAQCYAIAVSDWNAAVTHALLRGAIDTLVECGVCEENIRVVHVPGAFELTYAAGKLQRTGGYDGIIVLGCVVRGGTPHFDYVCQGTTQGITALNARDGVCPVIFGLLTTDDMQQALDRAGGVHGNKGVEAAITAIKMADIVW